MKNCLSLCLLFICTACVSTMNVTSSFTGEPFDPNQYATYSWTPVPERRNVTPKQEAIEEAVRKSVDAELTSRGYQLVASGGDLLIRQDGVLQVEVEELSKREERMVRAQEQMVMVEGETIVPPAPTADISRFGTLLIYVSDTQSGRVLWQGRAEDVIDYEGQGRKKVPEAVRLMFDGFPSH
ncbi:MAG: DUF4136 domain-containing protein, partial [Gammaproteobacteria bacterium]